MNTHPERQGFGVKMLVVFTGCLLTTPEYSPRFGELLLTLHYQSLIEAAAILGVMLDSRSPRFRLQTVVLVSALFALMLLSYACSGYTYTPQAQQWLREYWKMVLYCLLIAYGLRSPQSIAFLLKWTCMISFFYQILSWKGYLSGGCYVWQQGIKRMCGAWTMGGYGAANGYASGCLFTLPMAVWLLRSADKKSSKRLAGLMVLLSFLSIVRSGTRGAMIAAVVYGAVVFRPYVFRLSTAAAGVLVVILAVTLTPAPLWDRYVGSLSLFSSAAADLEGTDNIARESAEGRIEGLLDGIALGLNRPILGYGPGSSAYARREVNDIGIDIQLHNLYGQVAGELGICGAALWLWLVLTSVWELLRMRPSPSGPSSKDESLAYSLRIPLLHLMLILLMYGMVSHTLYDYRWLFTFGCQSALSGCLLYERQRLGSTRRQQALIT